MSILAPAARRGNNIVHRGRTYFALPVHLRLALTLSHILRKAARWLNRLADRIETWARVRSLLSGKSHAFDTITLTPLSGDCEPTIQFTAVRDAQHKVIALSAEHCRDTVKVGVQS